MSNTREHKMKGENTLRVLRLGEMFRNGAKETSVSGLSKGLLRLDKFKLMRL